MQLSPTLTDSLVDEVHALVRQFSPHVESAQTDLIEAGILDSASLVRLLLTVEARFAVAIPMEEVDIDSFRTVAAIADLVRERKAAPANAELRGAPGRTVLPQPRGAAPGPVPERDGLLAQIHELMANSLSIEISSPEEDLFKAGILDSLLLVQLIMVLESQFGVSVSLEDVDVTAFSTTAGIAQLVRRLASGPEAIAMPAGRGPYEGWR